MPLLLTGYTMTERTIIPAISKAIDGCVRNNELELADLLAGMKATLNDFLRSHNETPRPKAQKYESKARLKEAIRERNIGISDGIIESIADSYWAKGVTASQYAALPLNIETTFNKSQRPDWWTDADERAANTAAANRAERANIEASTSHVPTIDSQTPDEPGNDPNMLEDDEPIDQELYDMTMAVMDKYPDLEGPEIAKRAAYNLEYKIPIDKI